MSPEAPIATRLFRFLSGFGLATFLLFKVAPILLVGWVVVKVFEKSRGGGALSDADRRWLEGD